MVYTDPRGKRRELRTHCNFWGGRGVAHKKETRKANLRERPIHEYQPQIQIQIGRERHRQRVGTMYTGGLDCSDSRSKTGQKIISGLLFSLRREPGCELGSGEYGKKEVSIGG